MMVKVMGSLLLLFGCSAFGVSSVRRLRHRAESLEALCGLLETMRMEICGRLVPLPELFQLLPDHSPKLLHRFLCRIQSGMRRLNEKPFAELWRETACSSPELFLRPAEEMALAELGYTLTRCTAAELDGALHGLAEKMRRCGEQAREEQRRDSRVHLGLWVTGGIFAVILLI